MQITCSDKKDAATGTEGGKLSAIWWNENDEMFSYIETTEHMIARKQPVQQGMSGDQILQLPLRKSLFAHVPPYIIFQAGDASDLELPPEILKHLIWKRSFKLSPVTVYKIVKSSGFTISKNPNDDWIGTWSLSLSFVRIGTVKSFQKINHIPGITQISNKILLWKNYQKMVKKFGTMHFDYMPISYTLPEEGSRFRKVLNKRGGVWIIKPPNSCAGQGIRVISKWCEIPRECSLIVQYYVLKPKLINGFKFDLRLYVLLTSLDPLRVYLYSDGLIRFATDKYLSDVGHLFDKFMHLTNTSINKFSPWFKSSNDVDACKGSMWSLRSLWTYLGNNTSADITKIWDFIKDIVIKTILSAEDDMLKTSLKILPSSYNAHQLLGFDIILDENLRPWLLEVNSCPSMDMDTPLCATIKTQLAQDYLNLVGFHLPDTLPAKETEILSRRYAQETMLYDHRLHDLSMTETAKQKQQRFSNVKNRQDYVNNIIEDLTPDDVRVLIRHEDEISQAGRFERIFPTRSSHKYFKYFQELRYCNKLLDTWENTYCEDRQKGVERLQSLCNEKYHLLRTPTISTDEACQK